MEIHILRIDCTGKKHTASFKIVLKIKVTEKNPVSTNNILKTFWSAVPQELLKQLISFNDLLLHVYCISVSTRETILIEVLV